MYECDWSFPISTVTSVAIHQRFVLENPLITWSQFSPHIYTNKSLLIVLCVCVFNRVGGDDFDDVEDDDNIDDLNQEEEADNFEIITQGQTGGGVPKSKRITTKYMTK